jgi:hypothetical protein
MARLTDTFSQDLGQIVNALGNVFDSL